MMTYSEAIRLGSMLYPQTRAVYFDGTATCANGAAFAAISELLVTTDPEEIFKTLGRVFPIFNESTECRCGCGFKASHLLGEIVQHLNDRHRWTYNQIADFVELKEKTFEEKLENVLIEKF